MIQVRKLYETETKAALALAMRVFMRFEAPDYSAQGVQTFRRTLEDTAFTSQIVMYGAFEEQVMVGMIATRMDGAHITLFFVEEAYQRRGIGRMLFTLVLAKLESETMTVNASPFAVDIYKRLGFEPVMAEQCTRGIRYTPMRMIMPR